MCSFIRFAVLILILTSSFDTGAEEPNAQTVRNLRVIESEIGRKYNGAADRAVESASKAAGPAPVIKIVRGNQGIAMPDSAAISRAIEQESAPMRAQLEQQIASIDFANLQPKPWRDFVPTCTGSQSTREPVAGGKGDKVIYDSLFIRADQVPKDPRKVFGKKTIIYSYTRGSNDPATQSINSSPAPCLPYRMRITGRHFLFDQGENALKNYDKGALGGGILDSSVKNDT